MGNKSTTIKCNNCLNDEFFTTTLGLEVCSKCFLATGYFGESTGRLSYRQIDIEEDRLNERN